MLREKHIKPFTVANLDYLEKQGRIWLNPKYQREAVWTRSQKQLLIDSLLQDIDIPKLYFRAVSKGKYQYEVVNGQQRLRAISEYISDGFPLADNADPIEKHPTKGSHMKDLHTDLQMKLRDCQLDVCVLQNGYSDDDIEEIFLRLQNGTPLNAAEKRRALPGHMRAVVEELAHHKVFTGGLCGFKDKRYAYEDASAKLLHLAIAGEITDIKHASLRRTYVQHKSIKESDPAVVRVKAALNFINRAFKGGPSPKFKKNSVITVGYLAMELLEQYDLSDFPKQFGKAYLAFEQRRLENEELEESEQDSRLAEYTLSARGDRPSDLEFRDEVLRREIIAALPELERKDDDQSFSPDQRQAIFLRDSGICKKCGAQCTQGSFQADHIKAYAKGGRTKISNSQVLCATCNAKKGKKVN